MEVNFGGSKVEMQLHTETSAQPAPNLTKKKSKKRQKTAGLQEWMGWIEQLH